jgi:hypothetical protein
MKTFVVRRYVAAVIALIAMLNLIAVTPVLAGRRQSGSGGAQGQAEFSPEELEVLRSRLLELFDAIKESDSLLPDNDNTLDNLAKARAQIERFSAKDLTVLRRGLDPSLVDWTKLARARQTLVDYKQSDIGRAQQKAREKEKALSPSSAGFPGASPFCGSPRAGAEAIIAVDAVFFTADLVRELAQDGCKQEVVALGEGGNTSLACTVIDIGWVGNKVIFEAAHFCDTDFTNATVDASYARLEHIHNDLENSVANDNANTANIIANANSNTASIIANASSNTTAITNNANANTTTITTAISNAVSSITGGSSGSQNQLIDLILNTQIEADLAREPGLTPVAFYELPSSAGGQLDRVRAIVAQTIARVQAAGGSVGPAQTFLAQGDQYKAAGQFKPAYDAYRKAYQMAAR